MKKSSVSAKNESVGQFYLQNRNPNPTEKAEKRSDGPKKKSDQPKMRHPKITGSKDSSEPSKKNLPKADVSFEQKTVRPNSSKVQPQKTRKKTRSKKAKKQTAPGNPVRASDSPQKNTAAVKAHASKPDEGEKDIPIYEKILGLVLGASSI